jgi:protein-disulfide isomerase
MSKKQSKATKQANAQRAAERAAAIRAEQERKERRKRTLIITAAVVGVLVLVVAIVVAVQAGRDTTGRAATAPQGAVDTYALPMGPDDAPVTVTVYEDFMCPYCGLFEQVSSERLKEYADSGDVQVRYHVVSFLDDASSTDYSTRAANAMAVVLDTAGPEVAVDFHDALFANQPEEGSSGLSDEELVDLAVEAGAEEEQITDPIEDLAFEQWVVNATGEWSDRGFTGTPTVTVNDEQIEFSSAEELVANTEKAIDEALAE